MEFLQCNENFEEEAEATFHTLLLRSQMRCLVRLIGCSVINTALVEAYDPKFLQKKIVSLKSYRKEYACML